MTYTKIRMDFDYGPNGRFYRVFLIKGNPDLFELGIYLGMAVGAAFEHCFLIVSTKREDCYVMAPFMEDPIDGYKYLRNYHLDDLEDTFRFEYDTGDGWDFVCKRYKRKVELDSDKEIILLEGKGQGIWEDNIYTLYALFRGEVNPESTKENKSKGFCKPWNYKIKKFGDFDLPLNIQELNDDLFDAHEYYEAMLSNEIRYIEDNDVCLDDYNDEWFTF